MGQKSDGLREPTTQSVRTVGEVRNRMLVSPLAARHVLAGRV